MEYDVKAMIRQRRSVRTFKKEPVKPETLQKLEAYLQQLDNPFGIPVEFRILDAKQYSLTSPVLVGESVYVGAKVKHIPQSELAFGYEFEKFCLYAEALGLATVMLASTMDRPAFEKAMEVDKESDEVMMLVSPIGYKAEKMSVRETMMRKSVKGDERMDFEKICFADSFDKSVCYEQAGIFADAVEMVRLAPSAINNQPWRLVLAGDKVHFYKNIVPQLTNRPLCDIQKVDMGIALAHFELTMAAEGKTCRLIIEDPQLAHPDGLEYIASYEID